MKSIGICLGASNIKVAIVEKIEGRVTVTTSKIVHHNSNPRVSLELLMDELQIADYRYGTITGRKFRDSINLPSITEPEAVENALEYLRQSGDTVPYSAIASLGAENFIVYLLDKNGSITSIEAGNKCASGTGEFFLQQIRRMDTEIGDAVNLAYESDLYKVSGRCSVFCKSDCTHALNKGIPVGRISAGLCSMIAEKAVDLLGRVGSSHVLVVGGVSRNHAVMQFIRKRIPNLSIPVHADIFEAVGAAYYAYQKQCNFDYNRKTLFSFNRTSFDSLPPVKKGESLVTFKSTSTSTALTNDKCVVGLDVGSTTTKAVLLRISDNSVLASVYLRTNGNPVKASRECYEAIIKQCPNQPVVIGIGTTGSGRQIAALHAQTSAVVNEIIAHATAATFFDPEVDTIFEIGGQDAKYTYLVNGVPADYAMNEACSAGTGSFLEEAAKESLNIDYKDIGTIALKGNAPPNFNDQCAAFISSDIKTAGNEGIDRENIIAGLVYSICMNYINRVKGQRPLGKKIFMQGGVCYNYAVPLAMANLIGKEIIVPPQPGLMGAFGVALETKSLIQRGAMDAFEYNLETLAARDIEYGKSFICKDISSKCDRKCEINMLIFDGKKFPFGGACNKYYNLINHTKFDSENFNWVQIRSDLLFDKHNAPNPATAKATIGIPRSFLTHMLLPLYSQFFTALGYKVILSDEIDPEGLKYKRTQYCFPGEISHGAYYNLLTKKPDYIFLPKVAELYVENAQSQEPEHQCTCLLLQSEAYYIKSAFKDIPNQPPVLSPQLDFSQGFHTQKDQFILVGKSLGKTKKDSLKAYLSGVSNLQAFNSSLKEKGREILNYLKQNESQTAIVLFGRPYNAFAQDANLNIPAKFASKGVHIIPWDCLPFEDEQLQIDMCWAIGQNLLKAAIFVAKNPQLFGTYITNFSCGPDSFLINHFRDSMGTKPSLTLELDSHTADAGVNTRIEAFLDIISKYRQLSKPEKPDTNFTAAKIDFHKGKVTFSSTDGNNVPLTHPKVHLLLPSMGLLSSQILSAVFTGAGIRTSEIPVYDMDVLKKGRSVASCKECLPLLLTTGGLLDYLAKRKNTDEYLVYFMPTTPGNCRFTQYHVFQEQLITKNKIKDVAFLSLTNENGYAGLSSKCMLNSLKGIIIADIMDDIKNALTVLAVDKEDAMRVFFKLWEEIVKTFQLNQDSLLYPTLKLVSAALKEIPLKYPLKNAKKVDLLGEIFVRRDDFSCHTLIEGLAKKEIVVRRAHVLEWLHYCDWNVEQGIYHANFSPIDWIKFKAKGILSKKFENKIKYILSKSGLYEFEEADIDSILQYGKQFFDVHLSGEAILVVGSFFKNIIHSTQGVLSIGPFGCMPTRVIDAILSAEASMETKNKLDKIIGTSLHNNLDIHTLPFLSVEADGNPFPQIIEARIEAFCLQVDRLWKKIHAHKEQLKMPDSVLQPIRKGK